MKLVGDTWRQVALGEKHRNVVMYVYNTTNEIVDAQFTKFAE